MAFIPTADSVRAVVRWTHGAEEFSNVFHFLKTSFTVQDMEDLADAMDSSVATEWLADVSDDFTYVQTDVYDIRTIGGQIKTNNGGTGPGPQTGNDGLPPSVALVLTLYTATRGRAGRGRAYIGTMSETEMQNGIFNAGAITAALTNYNAVVTAATNLGWTHCVRSIQQNHQVINPAAMRPITSVVCRSGIPGYQRRRQDRP